MRIALLVDGEAEQRSLGRLYRQLHEQTGHTFLRPAQSRIHPLAPPHLIALACLPELRRLKHKRIDRVVVLLDRERQEGEDRCPSGIAGSIEQAVAARIDLSVWVVVKDRLFENWLLADVEALATQRGRFEVPNQVAARIRAGQADALDGLEVLKSCVKGTYHKIRDSDRILSKADILRIAHGSRSFRRFLRAVDHPDYQAQSKAPAPERE